jgi:hypothetical protein
LGDGGPLAGAADDGEKVVEECWLDADGAELAAGGGEFLRGDGGDFERFELRRIAFGVVALEDSALVGGAGVVNANLDEEAVELGFRERVSAFELEGILCGEDGEEVVEGVGDAVDGDLAFFHAFEERGLGARGHAIDFVGEEELGEDGAAMEGELTGLEREDAGAENVGGHHIGRALDAAEVEGEKTGQGFDGHGLGHAGNTFDEGVTAAKEGEDGLLNELGLAGDDFAEFGLPFFEDGEDGADFAVAFDSFRHAFPFCGGLRIISVSVAMWWSRRRT